MSKPEIVNSINKVVTESLKKYPNHLNEIRDMCQLSMKFHYIYLSEDDEELLNKNINSLLMWVFLESYRIIAHTYFFSCAGLYRNAFTNIRYLLELIILSTYIDRKHSYSDFRIKLIVLSEIYDKRDYRISGLIDDAVDDYKKYIKDEYSELSKNIHPSPVQIINTYKDIRGDRGIPTTIDEDKIKSIKDSLKKIIDILHYCILYYTPELKNKFKKSELYNEVEKNKFYLLLKI